MPDPIVMSDFSDVVYRGDRVSVNTLIQHIEGEPDCKGFFTEHAPHGVILFDPQTPELTDDIASSVATLLSEIHFTGKSFLEKSNFGYQIGTCAPTLPTLGIQFIVGTVNGTPTKSVDDLLNFLYVQNADIERHGSCPTPRLEFVRDIFGQIEFLFNNGIIEESLRVFLSGRAAAIRGLKLKKSNSFTNVPRLLLRDNFPLSLNQFSWDSVIRLKKKFEFGDAPRRDGSHTVTVSFVDLAGLQTSNFTDFCADITRKMDELASREEGRKYISTSGRYNINIYVVKSRYEGAASDSWAYYTLRSGSGHIIVSDVLVEVALYLAWIWLELI